jgi:hypothetical protein
MQLVRAPTNVSRARSTAMSALHRCIAVMNGREQLRVKAQHARQNLSIGAVVFVIAFVNLAHLTSIGNRYF